MLISLEMDKDDFVMSLHGMDYEDLILVIAEVDLLIADCGFTEELVKRLVQSLKADKEDVKLDFINWDKV